MASFTGTAGNDASTLGADNDAMWGLDGNDTLSGAAGNDLIFGEGGNDSLSGGLGNDTLYGDDGASTGATGNWTYSVFTRDFSSANNQTGTITTGNMVGGGFTDTFNPTTLAAAVGITANNPNDFGIVLRSTLSITTGGTYTFSTTSDDGSRIIIRDASGAEVFNLNNDFHQAPFTRSGSVTLTAGQTYTIEVLYWENAGGQVMSGSVTLPGGAVQDLATSPLIGVSPGQGADTLDGGDGDDLIYGGGNNDSLLGSVGNDRLFGDAGDDSLSGGDGNDTLDGGTGNDSLTGVDGNDSLSGGAGLDSLFGGGGNDNLAGGEEDDQLFGGIGDDTLTGGNGNDLLEGSTGLNSLFGGNGNDTLSGDAGNDTLSGGAGNDTLSGGTEDDSLSGDAGNDTLDGGEGNDSLSGGADEDSLSGGNGADSLAGDGGNDTLSGDVGNDTLSGGEGNDSLSGGNDADSLSGGNGNDVLNGDGGSDTVSGDDGDDTLNGLTGDDVLFGGAGNDDLDGDSGNDQLFGGAGNDTIDLDSGNDQAFGGDNDDRVSGGVGNDTLSGDEGNDSLFGGNDQDSLTGGNGEDSLSGGNGNDTLSGGAGNDSLFGGDGNDSVAGDAGNDVFTTDLGADSLYGGIGNDTFAAELGDFGTGLGNDLIEGGENTGDLDILDLTAWGKALTNVFYGGGNNEAGYVEFLDSNGQVIGRVDFIEIENIIPCFTAGSRIVTLKGAMTVENVQPGDRVLTRDHGWQVVRWVGQRTLSAAQLRAAPELAPVRLAAGSLGPHVPSRDTMVSPQHRMLIADAGAELMFGEHEVLVAAAHLAGQPGIAQVVPEDGVTYVHILFDQHQIVNVDGAWSESFQPAARMISVMDQMARAEILALFPELAHKDQAFEAARMTLKAHEARVYLKEFYAKL